jgi:uncharacterized protein (TIGR03437 family)
VGYTRRFDLIRRYAWRVLAVTGLLAAVSNLALCNLWAQGSQPLQIVTDSLPAGSVGVAYAQQLLVTGGACLGGGTAASTIDAGALPPGLAITSPSGVKQWLIQGTPAASGAFQFTIHLRWTHALVSPVDIQCTDEAVKTLTMTVTAQTPGASLAVDRAQVSVTYHTAHFPPRTETVQVTSIGIASVPFTVLTATAPGGNWLSVTPPSGTTPAALSIDFSISGLQPGVYTGTVTVRSGTANPVAISVTLIVITDSTLVLQVSPGSFSFSTLTGGQAPPSQSLAVTVTGDAVIFEAGVSAPPNGKWLLVSPAGGATPQKLAVSVDPKTLSPGTYNGSITVRVQGIPGSAQTIPVTFSVSTPTARPSINQNGVASAANLSAAISPGTWVSIFGSNLSSTTRLWRAADFINGILPAALDGVSVSINGKQAVVEFVSPTQVNVLAPDDVSTGLVFVQLTGPAGTSDNALALEQTIAPALFQFPAGATAYVAGTHPDGSLLAGTVLIQQGIPGTPAKPGETISVYGTGFGATQPAISATALVPSPLVLANPQDLRVRIGGVDAAIAFAGLISPGLYQFNVVVPLLSDGDQTIVAELRGLLTRSDLLLAVQH